MQKWYKKLSSPALALFLLLSFAIAMAVATFIENDYGTAVAWDTVYDAWWFELIMLGLAVCFVFNIHKYRLLRRRKWAVLLFHIAFIIILLGAAVTRYTSYSGIMRIREGETSKVLISDTKLLTLTLQKGKERKVIQQKLSFSPLGNNDFKIVTDFDGKPVKILYKDYVVDATPEIVSDSLNGEPILTMVVAGDDGRNTVFLKKGEIKKIGSHAHEIGFESSKQGIINILERDGQFQMESPHPVDFFVMSTQQAGKISKDTVHPISLKTLFRAGDFSFVPSSFHPKGKFDLVQQNKTKADNDKNLDDVLAIDLYVGTELKEVNLLYREGFLPLKNQVNFNNQIQVTASYGSGAIELPFEIKLNDFQLERYPGSSSPSSYASEISVLDSEKEFDYRIFMNNVLDYKGFRFFQASYDTDEKGTVLAVNHDFLGTWITYLGYLLMGIGMFFTFFGKGTYFQKINRKLKKVSSTTAVLGVLLSLSPLFGNAQQDSIPEISIESMVLSQQIDVQQSDLMGRILVQDLDGRIKPLNTLASECIRKVSRKRYFSYPIDGKTFKLDVNQVFLGMHKAPQIWQRIPIIIIDTDKTNGLFDGVKKGKNGLYSFGSLLDTTGNYILTQEVDDANKKKPANRTEFDKEILKVDERFNILFNVLSGNYFRIFPNKNDKNNTWFSHTHHFNDFTEEDAYFAKNVLYNYFSDLDKQNGEEAFQKLLYIKKYQEVLAKSIIPSSKRVEAEIWYNKANINFWLFQVFLTLGIAALIVAILKMVIRQRWIRIVWHSYLILILTSFLLFSFNILLRWYVGQHAPWSNGYEMLVFVAWCLMLSGLIVHRKSDFVLPLTTIFSGALLFVSYLDWLNPEITNLMPVLKSIWLKIHVAIIVSSYAPFALSFVLGGAVLLLMLFSGKKSFPTAQQKIKELTYINELSLSVGLFTLSIGTFLGGVWANESWGRYWAWDPKETWALISIIVYAIVLHLRFVPKLNNVFTLNAASMFAFWSIIMTSFGVNYYLSGLHSYATGDPLPIPKFVYVLFATMVLLTVGAFFKRKKQAKRV